MPGYVGLKRGQADEIERRSRHADDAPVLKCAGDADKDAGLQQREDMPRRQPFKRERPHGHAARHHGVAVSQTRLPITPLLSNPEQSLVKADTR